VSRHRYTGTELARLKAEGDSALNAAFSAGAAFAGGRGIPKPEIEVVMPEYAPVLNGMVAGDRFVLVRRSSEDGGKPTEWDVLSYDGRLAGTLKLPANFGPRVLSGDRLYGVEKDDLDIESVAVYRITPLR
jgi:hypothetical protein